MPLPVLSADVAAVLRRGTVIPAHPLALTASRTLDERHQRALTRYYVAAGAGGVAVGVHTTQFSIREPGVDLLRAVLELASDVVDREAGRPVVKVAGVCGLTPQAVREACLAADLRYDAILVQLGSFAPDVGDDKLLEHCRALAEIRPLFGFYLQTAVGGRPLGYRFWRQFAEIDNAVGIKIAPFDRYATLEVVRGVADSGRADQVALYTGNDDHIVLDLLTPFHVAGRTLRMVGGLLGHWAVWTRRAVELLDDVAAVIAGEQPLSPELLACANAITDANAAFFDPPHRFAGSIAGLHEVLLRQGLLAGRWCLDPREDLSPGQMNEIDRVYAAYPELNDDALVAEHLDKWLE
jgi:dihydrodipicolinate synthase/N-acetylneuraminate lyase